MADRHYADPEILGPNARDEARVRAGFRATLKRAVGQIPFLDQVVAAYFCALDPETPLRVRAILIGALAYFVMPFDAVPDFLAGVGFTDDLTVLMTAIFAVGSHISERHKTAARRVLDEGTGRAKA